MFSGGNAESGILSNAKFLLLGQVQNKGKETRKVYLAKEIEQTFWMQDLMELKSMSPSNEVCTCNVPSLECFEDSANPPS